MVKGKLLFTTAVTGLLSGLKNGKVVMKCDFLYNRKSAMAYISNYHSTYIHKIGS